MSEVQPFTYPSTGQPLRALLVDGEPWFMAADAAGMLELGNLHSSLALLDDDERGLHTMETLGGPQSVVIVSEAGLYSLILRSRKPEARAFKRWVTHDVLPQIRRTGSYKPAELSRLQILEMALEAEKRALAAEEQLAIAAPAADAWHVLASAHGDYSVREAAFMLNRDPAISTGQQRLFEWMRDNQIIDRRNVPYAAHQRHVQLRARSWTHPKTGEEQSSSQVRITFEGLRYLHKRLGGTGPFDAIAQAA